MEIKKRKGSFNDYTLEISYSELVAIANAMSDSHSGPIADELYAGLEWYLDRLPEPGEEDEEEQKKNGTLPGEDNPADASGADDFMPGAEDEGESPDGGPEGSSPIGSNPGDFPPEGQGKDDADDILPDPDDQPGSAQPPKPGF